MLKVLYLMNHAGKAGTERYVESIVRKLNNKEIKAYFVYNEEGLLVETLKSLGVETYRLVMRDPFDFVAAWQLSRLCKRLGIDLIHTQYMRENYIALWSRLFNPNVKVIWSNHFILANNRLQCFFNRLVTRLQTRIIAVCNPGRDMMVANGNDGSKIRVIFNAVDPDYWAEPVQSTLRQELGVVEEVFLLLCASRFAYDKGHKFLINAVAELKKIAKEKFKLALANDGPFLEAVKQQVKDLDLAEEVVFIGFRKDVKNLYYGADLYINSSQHEALSYAILEVLGSGLPIIATDMGGNRDIVNEETKCGILVKYEDAKGLAEAINRVMSSVELQRELKRNALRAIREKFNLDNMIMQTYNLYLESCKGKEKNKSEVGAK